MADFKPPKPAAGCKSVEEWEVSLTKLADDLLERSQKLLARRARVDMATGKELALASIRATKLAAECAALRERVSGSALFDGLAGAVIEGVPVPVPARS